MAKGVAAQELPALIEAATGHSMHRNTLLGIESGRTKSPSRDVVRALCRYFYKEGQLSSPEDIAHFCMCADYAAEDVQFVEGDVSLTLTPLRGEGFKRATRLLVESLTGPAAAPALIPPLERGLRALADAVSFLAPRQSGAAPKLERRVKRLLTAEPLDENAAAALASELERAYDRARGAAEAYQVAYLLSQVQERRARYLEALEACERAFMSAKAFSIGKAPLIKESLAALCEAIGRECLNIGTPDHWTRAENLFNEAIRLRQELKQELALEMEIAERRDVEALFQLARIKSHRRELPEAEAAYQQLLAHRLVQAGSMLRAHILKELADNHRFASDQTRMTEYFELALNAYRSVSTRELVDDPVGPTEICLNIAYCQRRLGDEEAAVRSFKDALDLAHAQRDRRRVAYTCLQLARSPAVQSDPEEAAYYALVAYQMMRRASAAADMEHAERLLDELTQTMPIERRAQLPTRVSSGAFAAYVTGA